MSGSSLLIDSTDIISANTNIPYALINQEVGSAASDFTKEITEISKYYSIFRSGTEFVTEGSSGDYVPADVRYKMVASLINKEARFLFAETPDIVIDAKGDAGKVSDTAKKNITNIQNYVDTVLTENDFEDKLLKAAKDCFIGKRVACVANFNETTGVTITWLNSMSFYYEMAMDNASKMTKFVAFVTVKESSKLGDKRIFMKKFEIVPDEKGKDVCWLAEILYNGVGQEIEMITEFQPTKLDKIPAKVFVNDGLTGETAGESEVALLRNYEGLYSKLANADIDAERKSMNPIRYTVDMDPKSTEGLRSAAGAYWDLASDQNLDNPAPKIGVLESSINYSDPLKTTLERLKTTAYEQVEMPNITLETMTGVVTSGKALKSIYWPLIVRCKEKMKVWAPQLRGLVEILIDGAMAYPNTITQYTNEALSPVDYEIHIEMNIPLPEDEQEEKKMDLEEVVAFTMSKKAYMKKWRKLTDAEVKEELKQMAAEKQLLEESFTSDLHLDTKDVTEEDEGEDPLVDPLSKEEPTI